MKNFAAPSLRDVFHRQLDFRKLPCDEHRNRHVLFRKTFRCDASQGAVLFMADVDLNEIW